MKSFQFIDFHYDILYNHIKLSRGRIFSFMSVEVEKIVEVGKVVDGKVTGITEFGAFVQLPDGNTGLVHISEVRKGYIKDIKSYLSVNQMVKVKVVTIGNGKIGLSIRKATEDDEPVDEVSYQKPERHFEHRRTSFNNNSMPNFEDMLSKFIKDSDERIHDIKRNMESKRGSSRR